MRISNEYVKEIFVLRSLACLGIVMYNALNVAIRHFSMDNSEAYVDLLPILHTVQLLLMYSTPMFVFISEFLLAKTYGESVPVGFFRKRAKFILIPYLTIACFYSLIDTAENASTMTLKDYLYELAKNIVLADFFGYFLLVIFQFYVLHLLFTKFVYGKVPMRRVIAIAVVVNMIYLAPFNMIDLTGTYHLNYYLVSFMNKVPFVAWIAYFVIAFYCGKNYDSLIRSINRRIKWVALWTFVAACMVVFLFFAGTIEEVYSKRFDVLLYTVGMIFCLFYLSSRIREVPATLMLISRYSFGIFLLARFVLFALDETLPAYDSVGYSVAFICLSFVAAIIGSIVVCYLLNKSRYGPYIVGKIGIGFPKRFRESFTRERVEKIS